MSQAWHRRPGSNFGVTKGTEGLRFGMRTSGGRGGGDPEDRGEVAAMSAPFLEVRCSSSSEDVALASGLGLDIVNSVLIRFGSGAPSS